MQENNRTIVWLGNDVAALPDCLRWARPLLQDGRQVLIGIDDPFPADREYDLSSILTSARQELSRLRGINQEFRAPLIVCCGPTEQRLDLRRQFSDLTLITPVELPKENAEERAELWNWFQRRTGIASPEPYTPEQDVLLVQLFFEWHAGAPIGDFASSFRQRIRRLDMTDTKSFVRFMDLLFAVNRLYINYPIELLRNDFQLPDFETAFQLLHKEESHLTVEEEAGQAGARIAHPHLANAIYESSSWYPREVYFEPQRRNHLEAVIFRSLEDCTEPRDKMRVLWALARLSDPDTDETIRSRIDPTMVAGLLRDVTEKIRRRFSTLPVYILPVLVELQARYPLVEFAFAPLQMACEVLSGQAVAETGLRLLCHKILQHRGPLHVLDATATARAIDAVRLIIRDQSTWSEWPHVALDYRKATADHTIDSSIACWITSHSDDETAALFIQDVLEVVRSEDVVAAVLAWLRKATINGPSTGFVLLSLLTHYKNHDAICSFASSWLDESDWNIASWNYVWEILERQLAGDVREHVLERGREWLEKNGRGPEHPAWPGLLARLIELTPNDLDLRTKGWDWQRDASLDDPAWTFIWEALEKTTGQDWEHRSALIELGKRWLSKNPCEARHAAWPGILAHLISSSNKDPLLREKGWSWLRSGTDAHRWWSDVWNALYDTTNDDWPHRAALLALGQQWFADHRSDYDAGHWPNIVSRLVRQFPDDAGLRESAWTWFEGAGLDRGAGAFIWTALLETTDDDWPHRAALLALGQQWFANHRTDYDAGHWPNIVSRLVRQFPDDADLRESAWRWLESVDARQETGFIIWRALYDTEESNSRRRPDLQRLGAKWIKQLSLNDPQLGKNWEVIFDLGERNDAFLDLGFQWARRRLGEELPSFILPKLLALDGRFDFFVDALIAELRAAESVEHQIEKLIIVLDALERRHESIDDDLFLRASVILQRLDASHRLWGAIWVALHDQRPHESNLLRVGQLWVASNWKTSAWASVWLRLTRGTETLDALIEPAINWLGAIELNHGKWPEVWKRVWNHRADCSRLGPLGIKWLKHAGERARYRMAGNEIWSTLWNAGCKLDELQRLKRK